jgi:hypothetical protein
MIAKQIIWIIFYTFISAANLVAGIIPLEFSVLCGDEPRVVKPDEIPQEFQSDEGNTLPAEVIKRYAIYKPKEWEFLPKRVDQESGYQYFQETFEIDKYGKIYLIAILINTPVEGGLHSALKCSQDNYGFPKRIVTLDLKREHGEKFRLIGTAGDILPNSLYKSYDAYGNDVYGYQLLLEQRLPKPVSDRKFVLRVLNHYIRVDGELLIVSEWYQRQGEGQFNYLRGCDTFYPVNENSHLLTIKSNADIGGILGGLQRMIGLDSIAESYLRRMAFTIKGRAEKK